MKQANTQQIVLHFPLTPQLFIVILTFGESGQAPCRYFMFKMNCAFLGLDPYHSSRDVDSPRFTDFRPIIVVDAH